MKKQYRLLMVLATLFILVLVLPVRGQDTPPPPPAHGLDGNQGTGCPLDRPQGILLAVILSLGYAGFALYQRGSKEIEK
jgi:hypothetical protein